MLQPSQTTLADSDATSQDPVVLCAGLSCVDHLWRVEEFPPRGSRTETNAYRVQGGGPAATAAATVAQLGGRSYLWALHGDDPGGLFAVRELDRLGVDVGGVRIHEGATSWVSGILVAPGGERYIFPYRGDRLLDAPPPAEARSVWPAAVLVDLRHPELCRAALDLARERGALTLADVSNTRNWDDTERCDYLIASEECAREILGRDDPEEALAAMRWRPDQYVAVTLGPAGYLYDAGEGARHLPAFEVEAVDTTGAGDVFHGAYAFSVAMGWDPERCGAFAQAAAAISCTGVGRSALPNRERVEEFLVERQRVDSIGLDRTGLEEE